MLSLAKADPTTASSPNCFRYSSRLYSSSNSFFASLACSGFTFERSGLLRRCASEAAPCCTFSSSGRLLRRASNAAPSFHLKVLKVSNRCIQMLSWLRATFALWSCFKARPSLIDFSFLISLKAGALSCNLFSSLKKFCSCQKPLKRD